MKKTFSLLLTKFLENSEFRVRFSHGMLSFFGDFFSSVCFKQKADSSCCPFREIDWEPQRRGWSLLAVLENVLKTCNKLSCKCPVNHVGLQAMFGTMITCALPSDKEKKGTSRNSQMCLEFCWARLKKATPKKSFEGMTFHSGGSDRHKMSQQVPAERLLCCARSLKQVTTLYNHLRDNKIDSVHRNYCYQTHLLKHLLSHQRDAPSAPGEVYRGNTQGMKRFLWTL